MRNLYKCFIAFFLLIIQFSLSILLLKHFDLNPNNTADFVALISANATIFGSLIIIYGFSQWKEQSNIQLFRELALLISDNLANERDAMTQMYALIKVTYASFRQFDPDISDILTEEVSKIFECEWEKYIAASCLVERNCKRLQRVCKDDTLKNNYENYQSLCRFLTSNIEYIYNFKHHNKEKKLKDAIGVDTYIVNLNNLEDQFMNFKILSSKIDTYLDKYIIIQK